jgi:sugar lactone lactonase YvrE
LCYVAVSGASAIEVFSLDNGKSKGRIIFPDKTLPRKICFVNDTLAFVTAYIENANENYVYYFNPKDLH